MEDTSQQYDGLCAKAALCRLCPNVKHDFAFLNEHNGNINAEIMFVGEAPGIARAENTNNPNFKIKSFHGNKSGSNFEHLLHKSGFQRDNVFVTNACLHTPVLPTGYMRSPTDDELTACAPLLLEQIELIKPKIIVSLGAMALRGLSMIEPFRYIGLSKMVAEPFQWRNTWIFPLFHPSPNVTSRIRTLVVQHYDYQDLMKFAKKQGVTIL